MKHFKRMAGMLMFLLLVLSSCKEEVEVKTSLSVSPNGALEFNAVGNENIILTVTTDAAKWTYSAPEWVIAEQNGNTLIVNASENFGEVRTGSISFNAGNADQIIINVIQQGADEEAIGVVGSIKDNNGENNVFVHLDAQTNKAIVKLKLSLSETLKNDANVSVVLTKEYLAEYNLTHNASCVIIHDNALTVTEWPLTIPAGNTEAELSIEIDGKDLNYNEKYLLPLKAEVVSGDVTIVNKDARVNYVVSRTKYKKVKQVCVFEINDCNPLNALEYKLSDGSNFFDAVVLFSGNMGWDEDAGAVRFNARTGEPIINGNIAALVNEWKTYIKPLRDAGMKVYMGLMPHWTEASITKLSNNGCKWFAEEMAQIVKDCQLDGVFLDEEYTVQGNPEKHPEWFADPDESGSYFAYQMNKEMDKVCDWNPGVLVYQFNIGPMETVTDHETGEKCAPSEYLEFIIPDYGDISFPYESMTKQNCAFASAQLNNGEGQRDITEENCLKRKEEGYGWLMWYAFNPNPTHNLYNLDNSMNLFNIASKALYDGQTVQRPTYFYKKIGEGQYDPNPYKF